MADGDLGSLLAKLGVDLTDLKKGLLEGKQDLQVFQKLSEDIGSKVKDALKFTVTALGIYEVIADLKSFATSILEVGGKTELLKTAAQTIGQYYQMSAATLDFYVDKLKEVGIEEERSWDAVNKFMRAGVSIDYLPQLAQAAKDLGKSMAMAPQEAFTTIIDNIVKGTPRQLALMAPGIREALRSMTSETQKVLDSTIISGAEKAQILTELVLEAWNRVKGVSKDSSDTYLSEMTRYKLKVIEVKEALFEFIKPVAMAVTRESIQTWDDLYTAIGNNKQALHEMGESVATTAGVVAGAVRVVVSFTAAHGDLLVKLLEIWALVKVFSWARVIAGAVTATMTVKGLTGVLGTLRALLATNMALTIAVAIIGVAEALKQLDELSQGQARGMVLSGEAYNLMSPEQKQQVDRLAPDFRAGGGEFGKKGVQDTWITPEQAKKEADEGAKKGKALGALPGGKGGGADQGLKDLMNALDQLEKEYANFTEGQIAGVDKWADHMRNRILGVDEALKDPDAARARALELTEQVSAEKKKKITQDYEVFVAKESGNTYAEIEAQAKEWLLKYQNIANAEEAIEQIKNRKLLIERSKVFADFVSLGKGYLDSLAAELPLTSQQLTMKEQSLVAEQALSKATLDRTILEKNIPAAFADELRGLQALTNQAKQYSLERQKWQTQGWTGGLKDWALNTLVEDEKYGFKAMGSFMQNIRSGFADSLSQGLIDFMDGKQMSGEALAKKFRDMLIKGLGDLVTQNLFTGLAKGVAAIFPEIGDQLKQIGPASGLITGATTASGIMAEGGRMAGYNLIAAATEAAAILAAAGGMSGSSGSLAGYEIDMSGATFPFPVEPALMAAHGGAFHEGIRLAAYGQGGIVNRATLFPMAGGAGLMGEAGPEGILPLARVGGDLGVKAVLPQPGPVAVVIENHMSTPAKGQASMDGQGTLRVVLDEMMADTAKSNGLFSKELGRRGAAGPITVRG